MYKKGFLILILLLCGVYTRKVLCISRSSNQSNINSNHTQIKKSNNDVITEKNKKFQQLETLQPSINTHKNNKNDIYIQQQNDICTSDNKNDLNYSISDNNDISFANKNNIFYQNQNNNNYQYTNENYYPNYAYIQNNAFSLLGKGFECERTSSSPLNAQNVQNEQKKTFFVGGNWKCNASPNMATQIVNILNNHAQSLQKTNNVQVVISPPSLHIKYVFDNIQFPYKIATQNVAVNKNYGAYTGETSAEMIKDFGLEWTIVGHSERREGFEQPGESDILVAKKAKAAIDASLNVILCIGEKLEDRESDNTMNILSQQLQAVKNTINKENWNKIVVAYEPVWAIGTGKSATPKIAQETHKQIRNWLTENLGNEISKNIKILYGGSVKGNNAQDLIIEDDIDGFLVGGASLTDDFIAILQSVQNAANFVVHT